MSYTKGSAWQRYATADELINIRHFYSVDGVPVPVTQLDGTAYGYYKTRSDKEQEKNYQTFYRDMFGRINKYGKKEYRILKPEYVRLQQIISDRFNVVSYVPEDRHTQNKYPSQNTKISTRPVGAVKAPRPDVFDPGLEAFDQRLLEEAGGKIEPTIDTSGDAYQKTFFPVIPEAAAQEHVGHQPFLESTQQILNDIEAGLIQVPDWFRNNIEWVKSGHITEQTFLDAYNNQVEVGNIHLLEQKETWWIIRPSGLIEQITVTQKFVDRMTAQGWIFSKDKPTIEEPQNQNISIVFYIGKGGDLKTHFGINSIVVTPDEAEQIAGWIYSNYNTRILFVMNRLTDDLRTHTVQQLKDMIIQKLKDDKDDSDDIDDDDIKKPHEPGIMGAGVAGAIGILILLGFIGDYRK